MSQHKDCRQSENCQIVIGVITYDVSHELQLAFRAVMADKDKTYQALTKILHEERSRADAEIRDLKLQLKRTESFKEIIK